MSTKQRILIIDDNEMALRLTTHVFQKAGYEVYVAGQGAEGLAKVKNVKPDLVVLDVMMPDMSGLEVCQKLRANPETAWLPIIMLSARSQVEDKVEGFEAGADDYVLKPVAPKELLARAAALLQRVKRSQAQRARTIAVVGAKGGVGVTTVAVNIAAALAADQEKSVVLAELRAHYGTVAHNLNLESAQGLGELLLMAPDEITPADVSHRLIRHNLGLRVLSAPQQIVEATLTAAHVKTFIESLSEDAEYLILDVPNSADKAVYQTLYMAEQILLVTEPEPVSIACAQAQLERFRAWGVFNRTKLVVLTRARSNTIVTPAEIKKQLGIGVAGVIPPAAEIFYMAASVGKPVVLSNPDTLPAKSLEELSEKITEQLPVAE